MTPVGPTREEGGGGGSAIGAGAGAGSGDLDDEEWVAAGRALGVQASVSLSSLAEASREVAAANGLSADAVDPYGLCDRNLWIHKDRRLRMSPLPMRTHVLRQTPTSSVSHFAMMKRMAAEGQLPESAMSKKDRLERIQAEERQRKAEEREMERRREGGGDGTNTKKTRTKTKAAAATTTKKKATSKDAKGQGPQQRQQQQQQQGKEEEEGEEEAVKGTALQQEQEAKGATAPPVENEGNNDYDGEEFEGLLTLKGIARSVEAIESVERTVVEAKATSAEEGAAAGSDANANSNADADADAAAAPAPDVPAAPAATAATELLELLPPQEGGGSLEESATFAGGDGGDLAAAEVEKELARVYGEDRAGAGAAGSVSAVLGDTNEQGGDSGAGAGGQLASNSAADSAAVGGGVEDNGAAVSAAAVAADAAVAAANAALSGGSGDDLHLYPPPAPAAAGDEGGDDGDNEDEGHEDGEGDAADAAWKAAGTTTEPYYDYADESEAPRGETPGAGLGPSMAEPGEFGEGGGAGGGAGGGPGPVAPQQLDEHQEWESQALQELEERWQAMRDDGGNTYYYNVVSGESTWELPPGVTPTEEEAEKK